MRWLLPLLFLAAVIACNRAPRTAPYAPEPVSSSGGPDGGEWASPDGGPSTAPTIQPQPGDIQL
jgi:hypothetical protein